MNLESIAGFIAKSGLRKVGTALTMFVGFSVLLFKGSLPAEKYETLNTYLILAVFGANAFEHKTKQDKNVTSTSKE